MEDEEFIAGRIDTGFIPAWQKRRKTEDLDATVTDISLVAAALAHSESSVTEQNSGSVRSNRRTRWATAGREANLNKRF